MSSVICRHSKKRHPHVDATFLSDSVEMIYTVHGLISKGVRNLFTVLTREELLTTGKTQKTITIWGWYSKLMLKQVP